MLMQGRLFDVPAVLKLRIVFATILILLFFALILGSVQLLKLASTKEQTIQYSVPALINSEKLATLLVRFAEVSTRLNNTQSSVRLQPLNRQLNEISDEISQVVAVIGNQFGDRYINFGELKGEFALLGAIRVDLVRRKSSMLMAQESIDATSQELLMLQNQFELLIEPYRLSVTTAYESALAEYAQSAGAGAGAVSGKSWESIRLLGKTQDQLSEIFFLISTLFDQLESASSYTTSASIVDLTNEVKFMYLGLARLLVGLQETEFQKELALLVKNIRKQTFGDDGIIGAAIARADNTVSFQAVLSKQNNLLAKISEIIKSNVISMEQYTLHTVDLFDEALQRTVAVALFTGGIILGLVLLVVYYVVELQINQRMSRLTAAVSAIAMGDVDYDLEITGQDEIGKMADALEVFKSNARELKVTNSDLQTFAYAASHDLKSPLMSIKGLAEWIQEDAADLQEGTKQNIELLIDRVDRLSNLQSDLLEYAKAGHADDEKGPLHLQEVVRELADLLDPGSNFTVSVFVSPEARHVRTYIVPLRQILLNLINNAIKHHHREEGVITVNVSYRNARLYVSVTDDGPGIDRKYHKEIFGLFKTLQSKDVVEGSGMGLSLVKKVVERYGGQITVISQPGDGTSFQFDWPA